MALIVTSHRLFHNSYVFPFYWYVNTSDETFPKGLTGVYELGTVQSLALAQGKKLALSGKLFARASNTISSELITTQKVAL